MHTELRADLRDAGLSQDGCLASALILEADWSFRAAAAATLERYCLHVAAPSNGLRAFDLLTEEPPAVLVLGSPLPDLDAALFARLAVVISHGTTRVLTLGDRADAVLQALAQQAERDHESTSGPDGTSADPHS